MLFLTKISMRKNSKKFMICCNVAPKMEAVISTFN